MSIKQKYLHCEDVPHKSGKEAVAVCQHKRLRDVHLSEGWLFSSAAKPFNFLSQEEANFGS